MTAKPVDDKDKTVAAPAVTIVDFHQLTEAQSTTAARVLRDALAHSPSGYNAAGAAEAEVAARRAATDWIGYAALRDQHLVGWIGAIKTYAHGWEIHPLVVAPDRQRQGIGSALLSRLEARAKREGVSTFFLGSDDDYGGTSLFDADLWPDVLSRAAAVEVTKRGHALAFYRRHGYVVVGVLPDVNGPGRHDILMARWLT
jgi:aminoglycoside 6'-N-acetyltransferase I